MTQSQTMQPEVQMEDAPANYMSVSIGKFSSSSQQENSLLMQQFFGKLKQFRSYVQDGEKVQDFPFFKRL